VASERPRPKDKEKDRDQVKPPICRLRIDIKNGTAQGENLEKKGTRPNMPLKKKKNIKLFHKSFKSKEER